MQNVIVIAVVALCAWLVLRQVLRSRKGGCGCSGGCSGGSGGCSPEGAGGKHACCGHSAADPRDSSLKSIR